MSKTLSILGANAREALDSLRKAKLRTVLGLVGIMIGISSVIVMVSLGEIAREQARQSFEALGTDILLVRKSGGTVSGRPAEIGLAEAVAMPEVVLSIADAAPRIMGYGTFRHAGKEIGQGSVQGVTEAFARVNRLSVQEGRFVSDLDIDRHYCVVGAAVAEAMRQAGTEQPVGALFEVEEHLFTVVGVLNPKVESYALPVQIQANDSVFVPITVSKRVSTNPEIDVIIARSRAGVHYETAVSGVRAYFQKQAPSLELAIVTAKELIAQMESQMGIFTLLLGSVGSISLVVGGIGIMNIMLGSVAERRREIAIRRALGARRRDIQSQFLIESVILTMAGGMLGILLGLVVTWGICQYTEWIFLISGMSVGGGLGTASAVGLFFGLQPARQASRLDPIAGLQSGE